MTGPADTAPRTFEGVAVGSRRYTAVGAGRSRYRATLGSLVLGLATALVVLSVWDRLVADVNTYTCPPDCGSPPNATPVAALPRFDAPDGQFSVGYPGPDSPYLLSTAEDGVTAQRTAGDGGVLRLFGEPARSRVARRVVEQLIARQYPGASVAYELPNTMVGYQLGYGVVANFRAPGLTARTDLRVIIVAAVKNDLALVAVAEGPFRRFSRDFGPGPPSAANSEIALDMGQYVESFRWKGDPPR